MQGHTLRQVNWMLGEIETKQELNIREDNDRKTLSTKMLYGVKLT